MIRKLRLLIDAFLPWSVMLIAVLCFGVVLLAVYAHSKKDSIPPPIRADLAVKLLRYQLQYTQLQNQVNILQSQQKTIYDDYTKAAQEAFAAAHLSDKEWMIDTTPMFVRKPPEPPKK